MASTEKLLERYERVRQMVRDNTSVLPEETTAEQEQRKKRARRDYAYFVEYYFPHYATAKCGWFHVEAANRLLEDERFKGIMEWARGFAKSTHFNVMVPMWLMVQEPRQINLMLMVGLNLNMAKRQLGDLHAELTDNQRFINDYGSQKTIGDWAEGDFTTKDGVNFMAIGMGTKPRGARKGPKRPDYIVCDDLDDDEMVRNESRVDEAVDWIKGALMGTMDIGIARFVLLNNRIHPKSILAKMVEDNKTSGSYFHLKVNALDDEGEPEWREKYTKSYYDEVEDDIGFIAFQKEYMNNPMSLGKVFKAQWFHWKPMEDLSKYIDLVAYCDPGFKDTLTSDYKALVLVGRPRIKSPEYHIIDCFVDKVSVKTMIDWHYIFYHRYQDFAVRYFMEEVFLQSLLFNEFDLEAEQRGEFMPIVGDKRKKPDKDARITAISPHFERGRVWWNAAKKNDHHMKRLVTHFQAFQPGKKSPKDGPDATEGGFHKLDKMRGVTRFKPSMGKRKPGKRW